MWVLKTVSRAAMLKRNVIIKLSKSFLGRVRPQTRADSELQLKLQRQAHTCGNALLVAGIPANDVNSNHLNCPFGRKKTSKVQMEFQ